MQQSKRRFYLCRFSTTSTALENVFTNDNRLDIAQFPRHIGKEYALNVLTLQEWTLFLSTRTGGDTLRLLISRLLHWSLAFLSSAAIFFMA